MTPGCTVAVRCVASISRMRFMREHSITTQPSTGVAPPDSPVPEPRGTNASPSSLHTRTIPTTDAVSVGNATAAGCPRSSVRPSASYASRSCGAASTSRTPGMLRSRAASEPDASARRSGKAEALDRFLVETEVVTDLVLDGDLHLLDQLFARARHLLEVALE